MTEPIDTSFNTGHNGMSDPEKTVHGVAAENPRSSWIISLIIHAERCTGCRICESVCSMTQEKTLNRAKSRIRIHRMDVLTLSQKFCDQCEERPCIAACPKGAIYEKNGQVRIRKSDCDGCRFREGLAACISVCDKLFLSPDKSHAMMCNQCGACVKECPEQALELGERPC